MAVNLPHPSNLLPVPGVRLGSAAAGIKYEGRDDIGVMIFDEGTTVAGVFTQSGFSAPPVLLCRERLGKSQAIRGLVANSGNANAATGDRGMADADAMTRALADSIGVDAGAVLPFSTGVIGEFLPVDLMVEPIQAAAASATEDGWLDFAKAIMTTDTVPKAYSTQFEVGGRTVTATGCAKGSGMIRPDMATMLAYIACDVSVSDEAARALVKELADKSFNRITVDGDTSTNDSFVVGFVRGYVPPSLADTASIEYEQLRSGLLGVAELLAQSVVRDGEGATKFVTVQVEGGRDEQECDTVCLTVAQSPLVKTAMFAGDPNWGRFCMAIGRAGLSDFEPALVSLYLNDVVVSKNGMVAQDYCESRASGIMNLDEYAVRINLGRGEASGSLWTSDLSFEYVKINTEYRT
ncbi:MAG: bifunctional glutamate N-acetyltransferase/amino-acid acetyltransferase ArgJ [Pseudomonadota bacterium]